MAEPLVFGEPDDRRYFAFLEGSLTLKEHGEWTALESVLIPIEDELEVQTLLVELEGDVLTVSDPDQVLSDNDRIALLLKALLFEAFNMADDTEEGEDA